jgi:hypothetical protein
VPDDDDTTGDLKPASELLETVLSRVQDAIEGLLKPRLSQIQTFFAETNSNTYVDREVFVARFIFQRTRDDTCPPTLASASLRNFVAAVEFFGKCKYVSRVDSTASLPGFGKLVSPTSGEVSAPAL